MYFYIYFLILLVYLIISFHGKRILQINLINLFLFAHLLLFVITPILFKQSYIWNNNIFQNISYISLIAIIMAFTFRINFFDKIYFEPKLKLVKYLFYIFIFMSILNLILNFDNVFSDKTMSALEGEYEGRGVIAILSNLLKIISFFYLAYLFHSDKKKFLLFYGIFVITLILTSAHRTPVVIACLSPIILYIIYNQNGKVKLLQLVILSVVIAQLMFFMNFFRQGLVEKISYDDKLALSSSFINTLSGINTTKNLYTLIEVNKEIEYFDKIHYWFIGFIPRKLYPDKPVVSFNVRTTEDIFGYKIGAFKGADVITYTVPGEGYIQFHYLGVFLLTFLCVVLSRILVVLYLKFKYIDFLLINFVFSIFINFRSAFDSFYYDVVYSIVFLIILIPFFFNIKKGCFYNKLNILNYRIKLKWKK